MQTFQFCFLFFNFKINVFILISQQSMLLYVYDDEEHTNALQFSLRAENDNKDTRKVLRKEKENHQTTRED